MTDPLARRVTRAFDTRGVGAIASNNGQKIATELPDLLVRDRLRDEARSEPTLSGELRRAVHANALSLSVMAERPRESRR